MLFHHGSIPYEVAAKDASDKAKTKLNNIIEGGRGRASNVIEKVMREVPNDMIVRGRAFDFEGIPNGILAAIPTPVSRPVTPITEIPPTIDEILEHTAQKGFSKGGGAIPITYTIHEHALTQMAYKFGVPWKYIQSLRAEGAWGHELIRHTFNEHFKHDSADRKFLVRTFNRQIRGFLSDRYRRLDSRPLVEAFADACKEIGAVPIQGFGTDTRVQLKAMIPTIFEPAPNEVVAFYVTWNNSDYGDGAHELCAGILRLWCTNYAVMDTSIRNVHLGGRLSDDIAFSDKTHRLDTATTASAIADTVKNILGRETISKLCNIIKAANEQEIDPKMMMKKLQEEIGKGDAKTVIDKFNSPDVEMLPPGNTTWRLSNAISWVAGETEDESKRMDLERLAGKALGWVSGN